MKATLEERALARRAGRAGCRSACDSVHGRRRGARGRRRRGAARGGRRQGVRQLGGARRPALIDELAERLGSQAVVVAIDAAGGEVYSHAGSRADRPRRGRVGARGRRRGARGGSADLDRRRRHPRRLRPRADARRRRRRCRFRSSPRAARATPRTSPRRSWSRRPPSSRRSSTRTPRGSRCSGPSSGPSASPSGRSGRGRARFLTGRHTIGTIRATRARISPLG